MINATYFFVRFWRQVTVFLRQLRYLGAREVCRINAIASSTRPC